MPKIATKWITNPASTTNQRVYDSTVIYDTTVTYDGNVAGKSSFTAKSPAQWSSASHNATQWVSNASIGTVDTYDSSTDTFDGSGTTSAFDSFDGLTAGKSVLGTKTPTVWANT